MKFIKYDNQGRAVTVTENEGLVKVSANDTTPGVLNGKLVAGAGITLTEGNDGSDETLTIATDGTALAPVSLEIYLDKNQQDSQEGIHGFLRSIATAQTLSSGSPINTTVGTGKVMIVVNAGTDTAGTITVTGTTINRNTGAATGSDTDDITIAGTSTDNSDTDAQSNVRWGFSNAYITSKWFSGAIAISTTNVDLSDVDVYLVLFEQFNDTDVTLRTLDFTGYVTNASAWAYAYLYSVVVSGSTVSVSREASVEIASVNVNQGYRRKIGNIDKALAGATDGVFVEMFLGRALQTDWENINLKVWATKQIGGTGGLTVEEQDGTPSVSDVTKIKVTNATLTDDGGGVVSIDTGGSGASLPSGMVVDFAGTSAPSGWLLCYGQAVSRTTYSDLFTAISTTYGVGDGSTTFNLPDYRGRISAGLDNMGGSSADRITDAQADSLGGAMGAETHTLTTSEMPAHSHGINNNISGVGSGTGFGQGATYQSTTEGGGNAHNNVQPTLFVNKIIKT